MKNLARTLAVVLAAGALQAFAQNYPVRPVRVVITFPPGSATDIIGRVVTQKLTEFWGQNVLADNRTGAGGVIGSGLVAKAARDGYTLLINSNAHAVNPAIYARLPYDTEKDFTEIAPLVGQPNVLVVNPGSRIKTLAEMVADAKARPGKINFASAGTGSGTHLNLEKFKLAVGIDVVHIPYKGTPEIIPDLTTGRVDYYFAPISAGMTFVRDGKLRALAVSSAKRSSQLPDVPTVAEAGVPKFEFILWFGMWGPTGMPAEIVRKISNDVTRALGQADVRERMANLGNDLMDVKPSEFSSFVRSEIKEYARIVKAAGIQPQ